MVNGNRYPEPVEIIFADQRFDPGRRAEPEAEPVGRVTGVARSPGRSAASERVAPTEVVKDSRRPAVLGAGT